MMFVDFRDHSSNETRWPNSDKLCWLMMVMLIASFAGSTSTKADETDSLGKLSKTSQLDLDDEDQDEDDMMDEDATDDEDDLDDDDDGNILGAQSTESLPTVSHGRFHIPTIAAVSTATGDIGNGSVPNGFRADSPRPLAPLPELANDRRMIGQDSGLDNSGFDNSGFAASWNWSVTRWAAANTYSNPRYFEDVMLERHGHERWGHLQPLASGMRFFSTIPMLPYKMAIKPPCDCEYTMGYYRTGSCVPALYQRPPWDRKAVLVESAAVATGMILIP